MTAMRTEIIITIIKQKVQNGGENGLKIGLLNGSIGKHTRQEEKTA